MAKVKSHFLNLFTTSAISSRTVWDTLLEAQCRGFTARGNARWLGTVETRSDGMVIIHSAPVLQPTPILWTGKL